MTTTSPKTKTLVEDDGVYIVPDTPPVTGLKYRRGLMGSASYAATQVSLLAMEYRDGPLEPPEIEGDTEITIGPGEEYNAL